MKRLTERISVSVFVTARSRERDRPPDAVHGSDQRQGDRSDRAHYAS